MQNASSHFQKIAVISNPSSGKNKRGGFDKFDCLIQKYPTITHFIANQAKEIKFALEACKQQKTQVIVVNGGDGTLQLVLTFLRGDDQQTYNPKILLLRAGTTSMSYGDVGCRGSHKSILEKLVDCSQGDVVVFKEVERSSIRMHLVKNKTSICGMFFGAGAIHSGILYCRQNLHTKGMRGELGPSLAMIRFLFDWVTTGKLVKPVKAMFSISGSKNIEGVFTVLVITTLNRLLMNAFPFWAGKPTSRYLNFTAIKQGAPKPLLAFMKILRGYAPQVKNHADYYYSLSPNVVKITINDGFTLDGELFGQIGESTEIELQVTKPVIFLK